MLIGSKERWDELLSHHRAWFALQSFVVGGPKRPSLQGAQHGVDRETSMMPVVALQNGNMSFGVHGARGEEIGVDYDSNCARCGR